jgi:hypothetical protein
MTIPDVLEMTDFVSDVYAGAYTEEVLVKTGYSIPDVDNNYSVFIFPFIVKEIGGYVSDDPTSGAGLQICLRNSEETVRAVFKLQFYHATGDDSDKCSVRIYAKVGGTYSATNHTNELIIGALYYMVCSLQWNDDDPDTIECKTRICTTPDSSSQIQIEAQSGSDPTDIDRITFNLLGYDDDFCRVQVWEGSYITSIPNTDLSKTQHQITGYMGQMSQLDFSATTTHGRLLTHWNAEDWKTHYTTDNIVDAVTYSNSNNSELTDVTYGLEAIQNTNDDIEVDTSYVSDTTSDIWEPSEDEIEHDLVDPLIEYITSAGKGDLTAPIEFPPPRDGGGSSLDFYGYDNATPTTEEIT